MSRLSKNIIYNTVGQGLLLILGFVAVKYIFRQLGGDALGIIYFTSTINALLSGVLEKGIYSTTVREVSTYFKKESEYIGEFIQTGSLFCWAVYVVFSIAVYVAAPVLVHTWINLTTMDSQTAVSILRILAIASLIAFPVSFYASLVRGIQRMEFNNIIDVSASGLQQLGIVMILIGDGNIFQVAYWIAACYGLRVTAYFGVCSRFFSVRSFLPRYVHSVVTRNYEFASKLTSVSVLAMVHKQADKVMISRLLPLGLLGYYGFAYGFISKATSITTAVAQAAFPALCSVSDDEDRSSLVSQYEKLQDFVSFVTVPVFAAITFMALPLLKFVFDGRIAETLYLPVLLLCLGFYLNATVAIPYRLSLAAGRPDIAVRQNLYAIFTVLPATFVAIYFWGLPGAAMGWILYFLFCYAYSVPRICRECMKKPLWFFYGSLLRIFVLTALTYGIAYGIVAVFNTFTMFSLGTAYIGATAIFVIGGYLMIGDNVRSIFFEDGRANRDDFRLKLMRVGSWRKNHL
jgi:O-antigen/teichoic acid export membrane protein